MYKVHSDREEMDLQLHQDIAGGSGGGGGFYGGGTGYTTSGAGGGSGYIGNSLLSNKYMIGYNVEKSTDSDTLTNKTTNVSERAISDYAKMGDGFARITKIN